MASCLRRTRTAIAVCKAIISRTLFSLHGLICIWRVTVIKGEPLYWCLTGTLPVMILETIITIKLKKGGEWKWLCPSVLLYLCTAVPAIWFLELDLMIARMTSQPTHHILQQYINSSDQDAISNVLNGKLSIAIRLGKEEWCKILEQMLLLILIIGRWLLPKGEITREQLSQLLLVYIGMAADIIELFEAFKENGVRENYLLTLIILALWTASLLQFTFVLTATKSKRMRPVLIHSGSASSAISIGGKSCCPTEVVSIVISMMLQDGPFLVLRLLLIFRYDVLSYTNLFFTSKNTLVLVLQFYRLVVLFSQKKKETGSRSKPVQSQKNLHNGTELASLSGSRGDMRGLKIQKMKPTAAQSNSNRRDQDTADDEDMTSDEDDDVERARELEGRRKSRAAKATKSPTTARRESFKRQHKAVLESPPTSNEHEQDANCHTGTPSSYSDAELNAVKRSKAARPGRRRPSDDSTRGSMSDSREDVRKGARSEKKGVKRQKSAKEHWQDVKVMTRAIAFMDEAGKYKTLVLKPIETLDHQMLYIVESEHFGGTK